MDVTVYTGKINFCRLPIVQGGTFAYIAPAFAILSLEKFRCPAMIGMFLENGFVFDEN